MEVSLRTGGRDPQRQSSAGREAASCRATADSRASERGTLFAAPSRRVGSRYASRESIDHPAITPMDVVGAEISTLNRLLELEAEDHHLERHFHDLHDRVEQARQERISLEASVQRYRLHRSDNRSEFSSSHLENERGRQAIRDEKADVRRQMETLQSQIKKLNRDEKNLLEILERGGCILPRKKPRADGTGGDD